MHPHDQAIEDFQALKPHLYNTFVRLDLRLHYSLDIFKDESLLQLWFSADGDPQAEKPLLHLSCYGVEPRRVFNMLWPGNWPVNFVSHLRMRSIRQYYLTGVFFELGCHDNEGYDDWVTLLLCRRFEAQLEDDEGLDD